MKDKSAQRLKDSVVEMVSMIEEGEWAEHVSTSTGGCEELPVRLEAAFTKLVNEANLSNTLRYQLAQLKTATTRVKRSAFSEKHRGYKQIDGYWYEPVTDLVKIIDSLIDVMENENEY